MLYDLSCVYAAAITALRKDGGLEAAQRQKAEKRYAERAIELLCAAGTAGHFKDPKNLDGMKKDPDFAPLHDRVEFQKLCADWEKLPTP
jgi:hypothetical protein